MKNLEKLLLGLLVILIFTSVNTKLVSASGFTDVKSTDWYYTSVNRLVDLGITTGVGDNNFAPNNSVTKAEFVVFLCNAISLSQEDGYTFSDTKSHWSSKWLSAAITANIIDRGTTFSPNKAITRQEAAEMLCRSLGLAADTIMATPYSDVTTDTGYSNRAYKEYLMLGSIKNNERYFYPKNSLKRSEVAAVIVNLIDYEADTENFKAEKKAAVDKQEHEMSAYNITSSFPPTEDIYSISMKKGKELLFAVKREETFTEWKVIVPISCDGNIDTISNINNDITNIRDYNIIDYNPNDLEKYGLKNPLYTLEYETNKGKIRIFLGNKTKDTTKIYAMLDNKKVFTIDWYYDDFLENPLKEIVGPFVYIVHINNVSKLEVQFDNNVVTCSIDAHVDNTSDKFKVNGKEANVLDEDGRSLFRTFYSSVIGVVISDIEIAAEPKGDAEIIFFYTLEVAPYKMKVEFISKDKDYYYVLRNGQYSGCVIAKSELTGPDGVRESYKKLIDGLKK